jgi:iron-sulfur cluster assembly protein
MTDLPAPLTLTPEARQAVRAIRAEKAIPAFYALRVGLKGAGCGAEYLLGFDHPTPTDEQYDLDGIRVLVDRRHLLYVVGLEIDFESGEAGAGFTFQAAEKVGSSE